MIQIIDNFFQDVEAVRKFALQLPYDKQGGFVPGVRSEFMHVVDPKFFHMFAKQLSACFFDVERDEFDIDCICQFQIINADYEQGWIHNDIDDNSWQIAGVVYLTPNAPLESGTAIYNKVGPDSVPYQEIVAAKQLFYSQAGDLDSARIVREKHNSSFAETVRINNVYNRLLVYDTDQWHRALKYFGDSKDDSRLTLVFFAKFNSSPKSV